MPALKARNGLPGASAPTAALFDTNVVFRRRVFSHMSTVCVGLCCFKRQIQNAAIHFT